MNIRAIKPTEIKYFSKTNQKPPNHKQTKKQKPNKKKLSTHLVNTNRTFVLPNRTVQNLLEPYAELKIHYNLPTHDDGFGTPRHCYLWSNLGAKLGESCF